MHAKMNCLQKSTAACRSPIVFIHGFPDSPLMFRDYVSETERLQPWLSGRDIYTYSFPNRHDNPDFPGWSELAHGVMVQEFDTLMDDLVRSSPTGKLVLVAHDWGATHAWRWVRRQKVPPIERFVALSVGSSFRYDVFEHGLNAFTWLYGIWFGAARYIPLLRKAVAGSIVSAAGYRSETAMDLWKDAYHYWDRGILLFTILFQALFFLNYKPAYLDFPFPVLYLRTRLDRIASTSAFEKVLQTRADCRILIYPEYNHWFPEQHSGVVLPEVRSFLG